MRAIFESCVLPVHRQCGFGNCKRQSQVFWFVHQGGKLIEGYARSLCEEHAKLCSLAMEEDARQTRINTLFFQKPLPERCRAQNCPNPPDFATVMKLEMAVEASFVCAEHEDVSEKAMERMTEDWMKQSLGVGIQVKGDALKQKIEEPDDGR